MIVAKTIAERLSELAIVCTYPDCGVTLTAHSALVGDLTNAYLGARQGPVEKSEPLSAVELAGQARCSKHPLQSGIRMFPILATASLMDRWVEQNVRVLDRQFQHSRPIRERTHERRRIEMNALFAKNVPQPDKPRPKHRVRSHVPRMKHAEPPAKKGKKDEAKQKNRKGRR
ncbi:MAG TPA: hypothetical protein VMJ72_00055 [Candidatus Paceibacterota bacterium]|nr:hypothetical protein [Candidatus Paceibacterota bacterium]